jgi:hypothetical protein
MSESVKPDLSTPRRRIEYAEATARTESADYRAWEQAGVDGTRKKLPLGIGIKAMGAKHEAHRRAILDHFGWMPEEEVDRRVTLDLAEELGRLCDNELARRRSSQDAEAGGTS